MALPACMQRSLGKVGVLRMVSGTGSCLLMTQCLEMCSHPKQGCDKQEKKERREPLHQC